MSNNKYYIAPVLRNEFVLGFRFGFLNLPNSRSIQVENYDEVDGIIDASLKNKFLYIFARVTPFEYSEDYLIILFKSKEDGLSNINKINLEDVIELIPLNEQAKTSIELKNSNFKLGKPYFDDLFDVIQEPFYKSEHFKGVEFIWECLRLEGDFENYLNIFGKDSLYNGIKHRKNGTKANQIFGYDLSKGDHLSDFWSIVLVYERYSPYPEGQIGHFFDLGEMFSYYRGQDHFPENSGVFQELQMISNEGSDLKIPYIAACLDDSQSDRVKNFNNELNRITNSEFDLKIVVANFLYLKDSLRKDRSDFQDSLIVKNLDKFKASIGEYLPYIAVLLGVFFGREKFSEMFYKIKKLPYLRYYSEFTVKQETKPTDFKSSTHKKKEVEEFTAGEEVVFDEMDNAGSKSIKNTKSDRKEKKSEVPSEFDRGNLIDVLKFVFENEGGKPLSKTALMKNAREYWNGKSTLSDIEVINFLKSKSDLGFKVVKKGNKTEISYCPPGSNNQLSIPS